MHPDHVAQLGSPDDSLSVRHAIVRLRISGFVAAVGNGLTGVVLTIVLAQSLASWAVGLALAALSIGMLESFAAGGAYADRANRAHAMVRTDLVRAMMNLMVVGGCFSSDPWSIVMVCFGCLGNGLMAGYFRPAQSSLWASLVDTTELTKALATNSFLNRIGLAVGGGIGGILIGYRLGWLGLVLDALTFLATAWLVMPVPDQRVMRSSQRSKMINVLTLSTFKAAAARLRIDRDWMQIFTLTRKSPWMRLWLSCNIVASALTGLVGVVIPTVLIHTYDAQGIGLFQGVGVFALLLGSFITLLFHKLPLAGFMDAWGSAGQAVAYIMVGCGAPSTASAAIRFTSYCSQSLSSAQFGAYVATQYKEEERGRIYAAQLGASSVLAPVGMLAGSLMVGLFDPHVTLIAAAVAAGVLELLPLTNPAYWRLSLTTSSDGAAGSSQ